jgi:hypothetical protein
MKTYLSVPMNDKDRVKNLGALWDPARKRWFAPDGVDLTPFLRWVPDLPRLDKRVKRVLKQRVRYSTSINFPPSTYMRFK